MSIMEQITHTRIYGHGAADILKQAEINAKVIDAGSMSILTASNQELIITAVGGVLRFHLVSKQPLYNN